MNLLSLSYSRKFIQYLFLTYFSRIVLQETLAPNSKKGEKHHSIVKLFDWFERYSNFCYSFIAIMAEFDVCSEGSIIPVTHLFIVYLF